MLYGMIADMIVVIHMLFIAFVLLGGFLSFYKKWFVWIHIPAALWGAVIELTGWICPLTPLENSLRTSGGTEDYQVSFIEHYIIPLIYPENLTRSTQMVLGISVIVINSIIYILLIKRHRKIPD